MRTSGIRGKEGEPATGAEPESVMPETTDLPLRIVLVAPPPGVLYCLQRGRDEEVSRVRSDGGDVVFDLTVELKPGSDGPDFRGPFVQGPRGERFVYVRIGTLAGDPDSPWTGRAKIG